MKLLLVLSLLFVAVADSFAAPSAGGIRTIKDLPRGPQESLRLGISRPLYRSLSVSPIESVVVARAPFYNGKTSGAKIVQPDGNGIYDKMLLEMANAQKISGYDTLTSRVSSESLDVYLLVYKIADGKMAICFSHCDNARYAEYQQSGQAWVGIFRSGQWHTISHDQN